MTKLGERLWVDLAPALIVASLPVLSYLILVLSGFNQSELGLRPGDFKRSWGVFTCPLVHADITHLLGNAGSLYLFFGLLFSLFKKIAGKVTLLLWIFPGLLMFIFARGGNIHIGASGVVYALAAFLAVAGFLSGNRKMRNVSFLVIIYFGSMIWGLLPYDSHISWDGHLCGALAGFITALFFRKSYKREYADILPEWFAEEDDKKDEYARFGADRQDK